MSSAQGIGGERVVLAAATWTSLAAQVTILGENVRVITPLSDARVTLVAAAVTPTGGSTGVAVVTDKAIAVNVGKGTGDVLWAYSTAGGNIYVQNNGTNDLLLVEPDPTAAMVAAVANQDINFRAITTAEAGTAGVGVTAEHFTADGKNFITKLTVAGTMPTVVGTIGVGLLAYTFPAGVHALKLARMSLALQETENTNVTADTPEISLGSVIVVGAVATMTTATWEDIMTAQVAGDCDGAVEEKTLLVATAGHLVNEAAGVKKVHINIADIWAGSEAGLTVTGEVWLEWSRLT
jgi:hypothetical protein